MSRLQTPVRKNDNVVVMTGKDRGKKGRVLKVLPETADTAQAAAFLASDRARMMTGTVLNASGGAVTD